MVHKAAYQLAWLFVVYSLLGGGFSWAFLPQDYERDLPVPAVGNVTAATSYVKSNRVFQSQVRTESTFYPYELPGSPVVETHLVLAHFRGREFSSSQRFHSGWDFAAGSFTNLGASFFYFNEGYLAYQSSPNFQMTIGRKVHPWGTFDHFWDLNLWEPRGNWDLIRPFPQGLTGIFLESRVNAFALTVFASPIFFPSMNPEIREKNGSLVSPSRWYRSPIGSGNVLNRRTQFVYSLKLPEMLQLATQSSFAAQLRWNPDDSGWWANLAVANKPLNVLTIEYDYNLLLLSKGSQAEIQVRPTVSRHQLGTVELGFRGTRWQSFLSVFTDRVTTPTPQNQVDSNNIKITDWLVQSHQNSQGFSVGGQWNLDYVSSLPTSSIEWSYLNIQVAPTEDRDETGKARFSLFPDRFYWSHALQLRGTHSFYFYKHVVTAYARYMREMNQRGNLFSLGVQINWNQQFAIHGAIDILGVDNPEENTSPGFFNQFRTNDRLYAGISYAF
ncbi:MAG: hypothetical protein RMK80_00640 [Pseudobdellovibrionaceae bacterium]|nr:hypothetical protein [Pseudobdellovibrionaceae bacterium]